MIYGKSPLFLQQTPQSFFNPDLRLPVQLAMDATQIGHVINGNGVRQKIVVYDLWFKFNLPGDDVDYLPQTGRVVFSPAYIIQTKPLWRLNEGLACSRKIIHMQNVTDGLAVQGSRITLPRFTDST